MQAVLIEDIYSTCSKTVQFGAVFHLLPLGRATFTPAPVEESAQSLAGAGRLLDTQGSGGDGGMEAWHGMAWHGMEVWHGGMEARQGSWGLV